MPSLVSQLSEQIRQTIQVDPELRAATKPQFGHFQSNVALRLGNEQGISSREMAVRLVEQLDVSALCLPIEVAGPGFLNFRLRPEVLASAVNGILDDPHVGISQVGQPERVVIDYSSPNVAKQMHVGHLRTTIIGDCFHRVLSSQGNTVIPQNHLGDWGRQFGMLIEQVLAEELDLNTLDLPAAEELYLRANAHIKEDETFADRARARVVALQAGDEETFSIWQQLVKISLAGFNQTYGRLNVLLTDDDVAGESTYNPYLAEICDDLESRGIAVMDDGALVVFVEGFDAPVIMRNSAGGYGYDVTDMAAVKYRVDVLHADRIIYVTDARQADHFAKVFAVARKAGYLPESVSAEHVGYGMVLGADGKPYSTREGTAVHLSDLLDEAEELAAPNIALGAIKYADLSNSLQKDYVFDAARMTKHVGDTGPYIQYAHSRTSKILRDAAAFGFEWDEVAVLTEPQEQELALWLSRFGEVVDEVAEELTPHKLCNYLFELATKYSAFYENCPVMKSDDEVRASRLALCAATKRVLGTGLNLLGIDAPERM